MPGARKHNCLRAPRRPPDLTVGVVYPADTLNVQQCGASSAGKGQTYWDELGAPG